MIIVSYATPSHKHHQLALDKRCRALDIQYIDYDDNWLRSTKYFADNRDILVASRGAGFWAWKPEVILDALHRHPTEQILYLDASTGIKEDPRPFFEHKNFYIIETKFVNKHWTKRDCFIRMGCDEEEFWNCNQIWAGVILVTAQMEFLLHEWKRLCCLREVITDDPNILGLPNLDGFIDHRHDQSILTNLVKYYYLQTGVINIFTDY